MKKNRRTFLQMSAAATATLAMPGPLGVAVNALAEAPDVSEVAGDPAKAARAAVDLLGGMTKFVKKGDKVVVKPNVGFSRTPDIGATTSPAVMVEVVTMCLRAGARKVLVLDFPVHNGPLCFQRSGIEDACKDLQDTVVFPVDDERFFAKIDIPKGKSLKETKVAKDILECDAFINVPVCKSHGGATVSLGMKNLMGAIWNRGYFHTFARLHQCIADLTTAVTPKLTIVDASRVMVNGGPQGPGELLYKKTIIAGTAPATVDAHASTMADWYGRKWTPAKIDQIRMAHEHGLGEIEPGKYTVAKRSLT